MCSAASLASRNVRQEIALAWKHQRPLLPLLIEPISAFATRRELAADLTRTLDNFRAAMRAVLDSDSLLALRICGRLMGFWLNKGDSVEGLFWTRTTLQQPVDSPADVRARALIGAGMMANRTGTIDEVRSLLTQGLELARLVGDAQLLATGLLGLANLLGDLGEDAQALAPYEEAMAACLETGDQNRLALCYLNTGITHLDQGNYGLATEWLKKCADLAHCVGNTSAESYALAHLGHAALGIDDTDRARPFYETALAMRRELEEPTMEATCLGSLGDLARREEDLPAAARLYRSALRIGREQHNAIFLVGTLPAVARLAACADVDQRARILVNATDSLRKQLGYRLSGIPARDLEETRQTLPPAAPTLRIGETQRPLSLEDAVTVALDVTEAIMRCES